MVSEGRLFWGKTSNFFGHYFAPSPLGGRVVEWIFFTPLKILFRNPEKPFRASGQGQWSGRGSGSKPAPRGAIPGAHRPPLGPPGPGAAGALSAQPSAPWRWPLLVLPPSARGRYRRIFRMSVFFSYSETHGVCLFFLHFLSIDFEVSNIWKKQ